MTAQGNIYGINGPIIYLKGDSGFQMNEMVYVGTGRLVGEVIELTSERTTIEEYEEMCIRDSSFSFYSPAFSKITY